MNRADAKSLEDFSMWAAFMSKGKSFDLSTLKESCGELIKMSVQKSSGQQKGSPASHLNWENWERVRMSVLAQGVALTVSGLLDKLTDTSVERERNLQEEYPTWEFLYSDRYKKWDYRTKNTFDYLKPKNIAPNIEELKHWVSVFAEYINGRADLKKIGCYGEHMKNAILGETVVLVLSGKLDELED